MFFDNQLWEQVGGDEIILCHHRGWDHSLQGIHLARWGMGAPGPDQGLPIPKLEMRRLGGPEALHSYIHSGAGFVIRCLLLCTKSPTA